MRLAAIFSLDVATYAVMSNHYHIVLRVDVERAKNWSVEEVLRRWTQLFTGPVLVQRYLSADRERMKPSEIARVEQFAEEYRERFMNVSWFMRILNQFGFLKKWEQHFKLFKRQSSQRSCNPFAFAMLPEMH
jgi:hypothetical protein